MRKNVILFDLDGTLSDPGLGITNSVIHALCRLGIEAPPREILSHDTGGGAARHGAVPGILRRVRHF